jgi:crotonobetainyl-CoA:carnitine CoA-transferase CaiB-like acyl-CoA transferase
MSQESATASGPLDGVRVLDLTRILAGPLCTMLLGDMGADVIKVEQPGKGDDTRSWGPPFVGTEAAYYLGVNRNKRSMTLNLKLPQGMDVLKKLLAKADILIDNFKPGTLERLGLTDDWIKANAPRLIHGVISGYGSTGPKGGNPGYDFIMQAESGLMSITGAADGEPMKYGVAIVDMCTGMYACSTLLAALQARHRLGYGQRVEVCLYDTGISLLSYVAANYLASAQTPARYGNGHPNIVPYRTYPTRDGPLVVAVGNDAQFRKFAGLVGHPEWARDAKFQRNQDRVTHRNDMDRLVSEALSTQDRAYWVARFDEADIPCGIVNTVPEALQAPQTVARDLVVEDDDPNVGGLRLLGIPFRFSETPASIRHRPPRLGEHTEQILHQELGCTDQQIAQLRDAGAV